MMIGKVVEINESMLGNFSMIVIAEDESHMTGRIVSGEALTPTTVKIEGDQITVRRKFCKEVEEKAKPKPKAKPKAKK